MAIPKTALKNAMGYRKIIKPDDTIVDARKLEQPENYIENNNTSKLTFRKKNNSIEDLKETSLCLDIMILSGSEKKILVYFSGKKHYEELTKIITKPINHLAMSMEIGIPMTTLKKSVQRLEKKGFIDRSAFKSGRDGWTIYSLSLDICKQLSVSKLD